MGKSTISMVIFNSYVRLPEGISYDIIRIVYLFMDMYLFTHDFSAWHGKNAWNQEELNPWTLSPAGC